MEIDGLTYNTGEIILDKKKNNVAHIFGKYLNKSSYNNTYRMIRYLALVIVLMGALLVHVVPWVSAYAKELPFWLPWALPHDAQLKFFHVVLTHVTPDMNLIRTCVTDVNSTHGVCNYMNTTEQENMMPGIDITADAGIFAFPPSTFPINDTVQICVKSIGLHEEHCMWDINNQGMNDVTRYGADMSTFKPAPTVVQRPEIMNYMNFGGGIV